MKEELDKDVLYYYLRRQLFDQRGIVCNIPYGTVAIRKNEDGTVNRAVALCSRKDNFCRETGKKKSYARLKRVESTKDNVLVGDYNGKDENFGCPQVVEFPHGFLGCYHDTPTEKEERMLWKRKEVDIEKSV